jgi:hypothetical protein
MEVYHAVLGCRRATDGQSPHAFMFYRHPGFKQDVPHNMQWVFDYEYVGEQTVLPEAVKHQYTATAKCESYRQDLADLNVQLQSEQSLDVCLCAPYKPTFGKQRDGSKVEKTGQLPSGKMFGVGYVGSMSNFGTAAHDLLRTQIEKEVRTVRVHVRVRVRVCVRACACVCVCVCVRV